MFNHYGNMLKKIRSLNQQIFHIFLDVLILDVQLVSFGITYQFGTSSKLMV